MEKEYIVFGASGSLVQGLMRNTDARINVFSLYLECQIISSLNYRLLAGKWKYQYTKPNIKKMQYREIAAIGRIKCV